MAAILKLSSKAVPGLSRESDPFLVKIHDILEQKYIDIMSMTWKAEHKFHAIGTKMNKCDTYLVLLQICRIFKNKKIDSSLWNLGSNQAPRLLPGCPTVKKCHSPEKVNICGRLASIRLVGRYVCTIYTWYLMIEQAGPSLMIRLERKFSLVHMELAKGGWLKPNYMHY